MITRRALAALVVQALRAQEDPQPLYDSHDWLRLARSLRPDSPPLLRGAVAAAFHRLAEAEPLLLQASRGEPAGAAEAYGHLINLYARAGMWRKTSDCVGKSMRLMPGRADLQNAAALFGALARYPDLRVRGLRPVQLRMSKQQKGLFLPVKINGRPANFFWDSGANFSVAAESEAKRLGMKVENSDATVANSTGGKVGFRLAVAREVQVGAITVSHVPFMIFGDDQQPFNEMEPQERGGIGLPVQLALGSMQWSAGGTVEFAGRAADPGEPNLCFDGLMPVTTLGYEGAELPVEFDTGAETTDLWPPFAKRFPRALASGKKETRRVGGVGQNVNVDAVVLDRLPVRLGGKSLALQPAEVHLEKTDGASERYFGRVGMDLLNQAERVTLDFRSMRLKLE